MLTETKMQSQSLWSTHTGLIEKWLNERQELLVKYCDVAGIEPCKHAGSIKERMQGFCEILIDYLSVGHFEVYEHILEEKDTDRQTATLYPHIAATTEMALEFNDKYDSKSSFETLTQDLSKLGVALATRFELEDRMLQQARAA
jgi:regulator of sigma D